MLGFATVDVPSSGQTLTVWLTSALERGIGHTNAVAFALDNDTFDAPAAEGMLIDRYVMLTERTDPQTPLLADWRITPCDLDALEADVRTHQDAVMKAFRAYRDQPGKADLIEPTMISLAATTQESTPVATAQAHLTLTLANRVARAWAAWLSIENERTRRRHYMPAGYTDETVRILPAAFTDREIVHQRAGQV